MKQEDRLTKTKSRTATNENSTRADDANGIRHPAPAVPMLGTAKPIDDEFTTPSSSSAPTTSVPNYSSLLSTPSALLRNVVPSPSSSILNIFGFNTSKGKNDHQLISTTTPGGPIPGYVPSPFATTMTSATSAAGNGYSNNITTTPPSSSGGGSGGGGAAAAAAATIVTVHPPTENDVILGRGRIIDNTPGNVKFRRYLAEQLDRYDSAPKHEKTQMAESIWLRKC